MSGVPARQPGGILIGEPLRFALLGDPVSHSVSPGLYAAAFDRLGIRAHYGSIRIPAGDGDALRHAMRQLAASGGGNVTLPHKRAAASSLDVCLPAVKATRACNCFWLDERGRLVGDNTDVPGFLSACEDFGAARLRGASVLVLGAGGAARAVTVACSEAGVSYLEIRNRTASRAESMVRDLDLGEWAQVGALSEPIERTYDLVVNATSLGLKTDDPLPLRLDGERFGAAIDLVYGRGGTPWVRHASGMGVPALDGRSMLMHQAVFSLGRWGIRVGDPGSLLEAMSRAIGVCLGEAAETREARTRGDLDPT